MFKINKNFILFSILMFGISVGFYLWVRNAQGADTAETKTNTLSQEELVNLTKPAVVRIVQHVKGEADIPAFAIDFKNLTISPAKDGAPQKIPFDNYYAGSGLVINPDGYILTNSHVVSYQTVKLLTIGDVALKEIFSQSMTMDSSEQSQITTDNQKLYDFGKKIVEYLLANSTFSIDKTITVLNPSAKEEKIEDLAQNGFKASVVSVNDNFYKDDKDAAVIKINETNLPAFDFGNSTNISAGKKVFAFGFPATADFNNKNILESTFTQGVISSLKDSQNKDFKILESDAKVSEGSSGGPLFDENGKVIGLVTYQTSEIQRTSGDNFAFAIPIDTVKDVMENYKLETGDTVKPDIGNFAPHFLSGLNDFHDRHCQNAIAQFNQAKTNAKFIGNKTVDSYIYQCNALIASGQSIDSRWDEIRNWFASIGYSIWIFVVLGFTLLVILILVIIFLLKKIRKEEDIIESRLPVPPSPIANQNTETKIPAADNKQIQPMTSNNYFENK